MTYVNLFALAQPRDGNGNRVAKSALAKTLRELFGAHDQGSWGLIPEGVNEAVYRVVTARPLTPYEIDDMETKARDEGLMLKHYGLVENHLPNFVLESD